MFSNYVPRYAHLTVASCTALLTMALCILNNMLFVFMPIPTYIVWIGVASRIGRRRLIRLAVGNAKGWRPTSIRDGIDSKDVKRITRSIARAKQRRQSVVVFIESTGGSVPAAHAIIEALRTYDERVVFITLGRCMSAATLIACSFPQSDRFAIPSSSIMVHSASEAPISKKEARSEHLTEARAWLSDLVEASEHEEPTRAVNDLLASNISGGSNLPELFLATLFASGGDLYFSAKNAYRVGLIGGIIRP